MPMNEGGSFSLPDEYSTANCTIPMAENSAPASAFNIRPKALQSVGLFISSNRRRP